MQRVYYCKEKINDEYILECATFSFSDEEYIRSATNDIVSINENLIVGKYVHFENEQIKDLNNKYYIDGVAILLENNITSDDKIKYDEEFELSILAYKNNDEIGILRWNNYLKEFENKFLDFRKI